MSIDVRDLAKSFGDKIVLDGVSLLVPEGQTAVVIGLSGSGKSVFLKSIVRLIEPDAGTVLVDGEDVRTLSRPGLYDLRRRVGYVFQFAALFDSMTIRENIAMGLKRIPGILAGEIEDRVQDSLARVGLAEFARRSPAELSGGQRKRAGVARAIATRPKYLLYDEPTTGLDPVTTAVIDELIMKLDEELGVTSLVVTHDMKSAYRVGDRIAMLHDGRIRFDGTPAEIQAADDSLVRAFIEGRPDSAGVL